MSFRCLPPQLRHAIGRVIFFLLSGLTGAFAAEASLEPAPQSFNVPAGSAEHTLGLFSRQSLQAAVFSTDLIEGVRTQAVHGEHTPLEALGLMLAGTKLQPVFDATTQVLVIQPARGNAEAVIELPPYVVETKAAEARWSYTAAPGVEVISRCSDATVKILLTHHFRLQEMLDVFLPPEFRVKLDTPTTYVLFDQATQPGITREIINELLQRQDGASLNVGGLSNYRFRDRDAVTLFFIISEGEFRSGRLRLTPDYVRFMMENRAPSLPLWFIEGLMEVYRSTLMESAAPMVEGAPVVNALPPPPNTSAAVGQLPEGVMEIRPALWISEAETQAVKKTPRRKHALLPLSELFATLPPALDDVDRAALWRSQAALWVRWALHGKDGNARREALWEFVRRASRQPANETMFRECFGLDYAAAEKQLRDYLPVAVKSNFYLSTQDRFVPPPVEPRDATAGEISRIKGGLDRLEITYVKHTYPALTARYVEQARRTLGRAYDQGDRDPRLLAELGLCECDAGDDAAARPFLEAATRQKVVRPRAYYELARIDYADLLRRTPEGRFTAAEAGAVLRPLATALKQSPQLPEIYELVAEVWLRTEAQLSPAQFTLLDEGVRNFQWRTPLIYSAALLNSLHGRTREARALVAQGLAIAVRPKDRERFAKLDAALAAAAAAPTP